MSTIRIEADFKVASDTAWSARKDARLAADMKALSGFEALFKDYRAGYVGKLYPNGTKNVFAAIAAAVESINAERNLEHSHASREYEEAYNQASLVRKASIRAYELVTTPKIVGCTLSFGGGTTFPVFTNDSLGAEWDGAIVDIYASHGGRPIALGAIVTNIEQKENI